MAARRVAIIYDWLVTYAGGERSLAAVLDCYPEAELFALVDFLPKGQRDFIHNKSVKTSFIQKLPFAKKLFRYYLPLMPFAIEQFDLTDYDLVISISHAVAKSVLTGPDQLHISYIFSPMRYAWDLMPQYLQVAGIQKGGRSLVIRYILHKLRLWDSARAVSIDKIITLSAFVKRRIRKFYGRDAEIIYPPVAVDDFTLQSEKEDYYVTASRLVPYKRVDLIVDAFARMPDKKLVVIGDGPETKRLQEHLPANVSLLGHQPFSVLEKHLRFAKAFVYAAIEDFGIVPLEAQACGTPVIAFNKGGLCETVVPESEAKPTGVFFNEQTPEAIACAISHFEANRDLFKPENCRQNAERFSTNHFKTAFTQSVEQAWNEHIRVIHQSMTGEGLQEQGL